MIVINYKNNIIIFQRLRVSHSEEHVTNVTDRYMALAAELESVYFFQLLLHVKYNHDNENFPSYGLVSLVIDPSILAKKVRNS